MKDGTEEKERGTLHEVCEKLNHPAIRVLDRGYVVNMLHVKMIGIDRVQLDNGTVLHTGKHRARQFREAFHHYWGARI